MPLLLMCSFSLAIITLAIIALAILTLAIIALAIIAGHSYFIHKISTYYSCKCEIKNINAHLLLPNNWKT